MIKYNIRIKLESPCLIGSGEGFGPVIDSDVVFDEYGLPYIPAKRIKGCLRDSAIEILEMFESSGINFLDVSKSSEYTLVEKIFGIQGKTDSASVVFSSLKIEEYNSICEWLNYLLSRREYKDYLRRDIIIKNFTEIRQQTSIDEETGTAKEHSLRTERVLKSDIVFCGDVIIRDISLLEDAKKILSLACVNLRHIGTKRNRGFGSISCSLMDGINEINYLDKLEAV